MPTWLAAFYISMQLTMFGAFGIWLQFPGAPTSPPVVVAPAPVPSPIPAPIPTPPPAPTPAGCVPPSPHPYDLCWKNQWWIQATYFGQPGPTNFTSDNVSVDSSGALHLKFNGNGAQVQSETAYGYGTYTWKVNSPVFFDPNLATGLFTYNENDPAFAHREIDAIEGSKWGNFGDPTNAQFTVQPATSPQQTPNQVHRITANNSPSTVSFTWKPGSIVFHYNDQTWTYTGTVPTPSAKVFMNFWKFGATSATGDFVISDFTYTP
jgi:hypothetical protein